MFRIPGFPLTRESLQRLTRLPELTAWHSASVTAVFLLFGGIDWHCSLTTLFCCGRRIDWHKLFSRYVCFCFVFGKLTAIGH